MPLNASNFNLVGAKPADIANFNLALSYLEGSPAGNAILEVTAASHVPININHSGKTEFVPGGEVRWDPQVALSVRDAQDVNHGVQSPALGLLHEMVHAMDPQLIANALDKIPGWGTMAEYVAISYENLVATNLAEPQRTNHAGLFVGMDNPTTHTMPTEDADILVWAQINSNTGKLEFGPQYSYGERGGDFAPEFGSTSNNGPWEGGGGFGDYGGGSGGEYGGGGGGGASGCVAVESFLPDGTMAGDIRVGAVMQLGDDVTLNAGTGTVSYSEKKQAPGFRIVTQSGASLICSDTAPIPTKGGVLVRPANLLGREVAVRWDEAGSEFLGWETIVSVESVGIIYVQHITVGDKCFWAGEKAGAYILHHNDKDDRGTDDDEGGFYDPLTAGTPAGHGSAQLVGVVPPAHDSHIHTL